VWDHLQVFGQFINNSDVRAKHAIEPLHYGLAEVLKLRPVSFRWNELEEPHKTLGLIAQDVQAVIAEAVLPSDPSQADSRLGLVYNSLVPVLIRAVQELSAQVDALRLAGSARPGAGLAAGVAGD
jgi:Chaperone of endosialidase